MIHLFILLHFIYLVASAYFAIRQRDLADWWLTFETRSYNSVTENYHRCIRDMWFNIGAVAFNFLFIIWHITRL